MEQQERLFEEQIKLKPIIALQLNKLTLEHEKENFIHNLCDFIEPLNFEQLQVIGRPKANFKDYNKGSLYYVLQWNELQTNTKRFKMDV